MRPKIIIIIFLIAAGVVAIAVMLSKTPKISPAQPTETFAQTALTSANSAPVAPAPAPMTAVSPALTTTNNGTNTAEEKKLAHEEYVEKRSDEFMSLAALNDFKAHQKIVDALYDSDCDIRKAALDALEQSDDRSVIPDMQKVADQTDDPDDKQAIENAIDFIKLPSLTEYLKERKAAKAAAGNSSASTKAANGSSNP